MNILRRRIILSSKCYDKCYTLNILYICLLYTYLHVQVFQKNIKIRSLICNVTNINQYSYYIFNHNTIEFNLTRENDSTFVRVYAVAKCIL